MNSSLCKVFQGSQMITSFGFRNSEAEPFLFFLFLCQVQIEEPFKIEIFNPGTEVLTDTITLEWLYKEKGLKPSTIKSGLFMNQAFHIDDIEKPLKCCFCGGGHRSTAHMNLCTLDVLLVGEWVCLGNDAYISIPQLRVVKSIDTYTSVHRYTESVSYFIDVSKHLLYLVRGYCVQTFSCRDVPSFHKVLALLSGVFIKTPASLGAYCLRSIWLSDSIDCYPAISLLHQMRKVYPKLQMLLAAGKAGGLQKQIGK